MACCGRSDRSANAAKPGAKPRVVVFELRAQNPVTVYGRATGIRYHFPGPGAQLRVDARDAAYLDVIAELSRVGA